jgi:hypothetical protein
MPKRAVFFQRLRQHYVDLRFELEHLTLVLREIHAEWKQSCHGWNVVIGTVLFANRVRFLIENHLFIETQLYKAARRNMLQKKLCRAYELPSIREIEGWSREVVASS